MVLIYATIRQDNDICTITVCSVYFYIQSVNCTLQTCVLIINDRNLNYLEAFLLHILDLQKVSRCQDWVVYLQYMTVLLTILQQVAVFSNVDTGRSNDLFTNRINRRIRYLCEQLLEIMKQRMMCLCQYRKWCIHAHCCNRLCTISRHRKDACLQFLIGITECLLHSLTLYIGELRYFHIWNLKLSKLYQIGIQPCTIRTALCIFFLQGIIIYHFAFYGIDQKHLARTKSVLLHDLGRVNRKNADF